MEVDDKWLSIEDGKEYLEIVKLYLLRVVEDIDVHLLPRIKSSFSGFNLKDLVLKNMSFKGLLIARLTRISPRFKLNLLVIGHLESPISSNTSNVLECQCDSSWLWSKFAWNLSEVPSEDLKILL